MVTKELTSLRMRVQALGRELYKVIHIEGHLAHEALRHIRNDYRQAIKDAKRKY